MFKSTQSLQQLFINGLGLVMGVDTSGNFMIGSKHTNKSFNLFNIFGEE